MQVDVVLNSVRSNSQKWGDLWTGWCRAGRHAGERRPGWGKLLGSDQSSRLARLPRKYYRRDDSARGPGGSPRVRGTGCCLNGGLTGLLVSVDAVREAQVTSRSMRNDRCRSLSAGWRGGGGVTTRSLQGGAARGDGGARSPPAVRPPSVPSASATLRSARPYSG